MRTIFLQKSDKSVFFVDVLPLIFIKSVWHLAKNIRRCVFVSFVDLLPYPDACLILVTLTFCLGGLRVHS